LGIVRRRRGESVELMEMRSHLRDFVIPFGNRGEDARFELAEKHIIPYGSPSILVENVELSSKY
jgi:hypothetical protein